MVRVINNENFDSEVLTKDKLTVVDFFANWCGPCRKLAPILEEVETELSENVNFAKIDTDDNIDMAKKYQVSGLPTLLVFKNGQVVERMVGLMPKSSIITNIEIQLYFCLYQFQHLLLLVLVVLVLMLIRKLFS